MIWGGGGVRVEQKPRTGSPPLRLQVELFHSRRAARSCSPKRNTTKNLTLQAEFFADTPAVADIDSRQGCEWRVFRVALSQSLSVASSSPR